MKSLPPEEEAGKLRRWRLRTQGLILLIMLLAFSATPWGAALWKQAFTQIGFDARAENSPSAYLRIHVIDVGKADAILLESGGHAALLDAGTGVEGDTVADYLARQGIARLDYAIASHPDSDHIGGMAQVIKEVPTGAFLRGEGWEDVGQEAGDLLEYLEDNETPARTLRAGESFSLGYAELKAIGPLRDYEDSNNNSLVLRLTCFGFTALFCGDIEKEAEEDLLGSNQELSAYVLKAAHHGSQTSSTEEFLRAVSPRLAVVSVGPDNNRLPRSQALERLEGAGARILRTDIDGDILLTYDGEYIGIRKEHARNEKERWQYEAVDH